MPYSKNLERSALPDEQKVIDAVHCVMGHECRYTRRYTVEPDSERAGARSED
jgi:hypothetical protein